MLDLSIKMEIRIKTVLEIGDIVKNKPKDPEIISSKRLSTHYNSSIYY